MIQSQHHQGMDAVDAIAPNLFAAGSLGEAAGPRLIGARKRSDGTMHFPCQQAFDVDEWEVVELPTEGTLWSYTIQRFRLKSPPYAGPEEFAPYAVGYIELPGAIIIESRIVGVPFDRLRIGMPMRLTTEPLYVAGEKRISFAFTAGETEA